MTNATMLVTTRMYDTIFAAGDIAFDILTVRIVGPATALPHMTALAVTA
jgi:hypothetical protein